MPIAPKDIAAIAEFKVGTIDRYCRRIYARLQRLFHGDLIESNLTYDALWGTLLRGWVRTVPVAVEFKDLCARMATRLPAEEFRGAIKQLGAAARTITIRTGVILSFKEVSDLRILLETEYSEIRPKDRILFSMEESDVSAAVWHESLGSGLRANGYDTERAMLASYALARLAAASELFVAKTEELLTSKTRPRIYVTTSFIFALIIELYARSFEFLYVYEVAELAWS